MFWNRKCNLILADETGNGLDLSEFHIKFNIKKMDLSAPNTAEIIVYNMNDTTLSKLRDEFDSVILQAGYENNFGLIFKGTVWQYIKGIEKRTDSIIKIIASDGDKGFNYSYINKSYSKGTTDETIQNDLLSEMNKNGIDKGQVDNSEHKEYIRGKVTFGMAKDYLTSIAINHGQSWSIQDGQLNIIDDNGYLPTEAIVLNSRTGMVNRPQQTLEGIKVRCLLNSKLKIGSRLKIDESSIDLYKQDTAYANVYKSNIATKMNNDGLYRILAIDYIGDNRGNDWYCDIVCVGIDDSAPVNSKIIDTGKGRI